MSTVRSFALIGVGGVGSYHLASLQRLAQRGLARPVAVAEPMAERFVELKRDLEAQGVRWYGDYRKMLQEEVRLDAVAIATPIPLHHQMTLACLERGVRVNLEKPPVPLVQQLNTLIGLDRQRNVTVGFQMIASRCVQRMKQLIVGGAIGEVRSIRACGCWPRGSHYYRRAGWAGRLTLDGEPVFDGPATNALAHLVHNIMFLAGTTHAEEFAVPVEVTGELYRARPIESYDVACLRGVFGSGADFCFAVAHACRETMPYRIEVQGSKGWLRLTGDGACLESSSGERLQAPETTSQLLDVCYEQFVQAMPYPDSRPHTSLEDATAYVRTTNGLFLSSGGVHDIAPEWVSPCDEGDGTIYDVSGLPAAVERVFAEGRLFSELGLEWAVARPTPVGLDSFQTLELSAPAQLSARGVEALT